MASALALASKVLFEREVLELRSQNEKLKLKLFWKDYNVNMLRKTMKSGNTFPADSPYCQCEMCISFKRAVRPRKRGPLHGAVALPGMFSTDLSQVCTFGPWFAKKAKSFGLTIMKPKYPHNKPWPAEIEGHDSCPDLLVIDLDCHLVNKDGPEWTNFTYGRRLWGASTVDNPELAKLAKFFEYLDTYRLTPEEEGRGRKSRELW